MTRSMGWLDPERVVLFESDSARFSLEALALGRVDGAAVLAGPLRADGAVTLRDIWHQYRLESLLALLLFGTILLLAVMLWVSRRRFRGLFKRARDLNIIVSRSPIVAMAWRNEPGWPLSFVSESVSQFGYEAQDFQSGRLRFDSLIHPDDLPRIEKEVAGYFANGPDEYEQEYRLRHGDGHWIWVLDYTWLTRDRKGRVTAIHGVLLDVTERKQAEGRAAHMHDLMRYIIEHSRSAVAVHDKDLNYIYVSQNYLDVFRVEESDVIGKHHYEVFPDLPQQWRDVHKRVLKGEVVSAEDDPFPRADGTTDWTRWECRPWFESDGSIGGLIVYSEIITERKKAELALKEKSEALARSNVRLEQLATVFTHAREGIVISDARGDIVEVNAAFSRVTGYERSEVIGRNPRFLRSGRHSPEFFHDMWHQLQRRGHWSGEIWNRRKNGEIYPQQVTISAVRDEHGEVVQYLALLTDVTEERRHERQLEYVSHYDPLTGLPNRALLTDRVKESMAQCRRHRLTMAVVILDLDNFKAVNEQYGSETGDRMLCELAQRLKANLRAGDSAARLGGDELVVLLTNLGSSEQAVPMLDQLLSLAGSPFHLQGRDIALSASIGVTFYPQCNEIDADQLLRQADQAMYQAKLAGKARYQLFNAEEDQAARGMHESLKWIHNGLEQGEFLLHYQPKVNMRTGAVLGAEALIRWNHPERGMLPPAQFLPLIENHPLALDIGAWVIDSALAQLSAWQDQGLDLSVSVNIFARQIQQKDFVDGLRRSLERFPHLRADQLEIEVLETSALEDIAQVSRVIEECQALGVRCALDDFGTGYSSLTYLKRLPAAILKIDQSFVRDMLDDPEDLAILNGILGLSQAFQREPVAEGVETVAHGEILLDMGCELAQGYGIARPMPAIELPGWIKTWKPSRRWQNRQAKSPEQMKLIFAGVEHRAWVNAIAASVQRGFPPPAMDLDACAFGHWLERSRILMDSAPGEADQLARLHKQVHDQAECIMVLMQAGKSAEAESCLGKLFELRDRLLDTLEGVSDCLKDRRSTVE